MKALDLLLVSIAIGLSLFTVTLFASDYPRGFVAPEPPDEFAPRVPPNPAFRAIVIHDLTAHRDLPFHFVVEDGLILPCPAWRDQTSAAHTSSPEANSCSIAVALRGDRTKAQEKALLDLLEKLCRERNIDADSVGIHGEVESSACPAGTLDLAALRELLRNRLAGESRKSGTAGSR